MPEDFKVRLQAELDTSKAEQQIADLGKNKKVKISVDAGETTRSVQTVNQSIRTTQSSATSFGDALKRALNIGSSAAVVAKGFQLIHAAAKNARAAIKDIDSAITDLRLATGDSYESAAKMVGEYNQMGRALGATTKEVNDSAVTWRRQGKSAEDAGVLIRDAMILSKVGMLDSADAAKYLTSSMKGYNVSVDGAIRVIDKLTAVDANAAVNAGGLAQAMSQTAVTANKAGVSMDKLLGYLAVVGETTQKDMSSIGNSFKTIFARMNDIKAGKLSLVDEDGTTELLSDVEITLKNVGIDLRATMSEFNNSGEVLDALAAKWNNLSSVQQAALAKAFAGVRQGENFRVLMENYDASTKYMNIAANSAGTAETKFAAYLDSIEAKTKSLQAAFESLAVNSVSTETFGGIIEATTSLVEFLDKTNLVKGALAGIATAGAIKGFTSLATGITTVTARFQEFNTALQLLKAGNIGETQISQLATLTANLSASQMQAVLSSKALSVEQRIAILTAQGMSTAEATAALQTMGLATAEGVATGATTGFSSALKGLWATLKANPLILLAAGVTAAVSIYNSYKQKLSEMRKASIDAGTAASEESNKIRDLYKAYQEADAQYKQDGSNKEAYVAATNNLIDALGEEGRTVRDLADDYSNLGEAMSEAVRKRLYENIFKTRDAVTAKREELKDSYGSGRENYWKDSGKWGTSAVPIITRHWDSASKQYLGSPEYAALEIVQNAVDDYYSRQEFVGYGNQGAENNYFALRGSAEEIYANAVKAREALLNAAKEGKFTPQELQELDLYQYVNDAILDLEPDIQELNSLIGTVNANAAQYVFESFSKSNDLPQTLDQFKKFRDNYLEEALSSGMFEGDTETVTKAVDSFLSSFGGFENFYGLPRFREEIKSLSKDTIKYLKNGGEATDEMRQELMDFFDVNGYSPEQFSDMFSKISSDIDDSGNIIEQSVSSQIGNLTSLQDELAATVAALEAYKKAMEGGEKGDAAAEMAKIWKSATDSYKAGKVDTNEMRAAADLFFSKDFLAKNNMDLSDVGEALSSGIWQAVFSSDDYAKNFVDYLQKNSSELGDAVKITTDAAGNVQFAYKSISSLAEVTGMSESAVTALLDALDVLGIQAMMSSEDMGELVDRLGLIPGETVKSAAGIQQIIQSLADDGMGFWDIQGTLKSLESAGFIDTSGMQELGQWINEATKGLDELGGKEESPTVDVKDNATAILLRIQGLLSGINGTHAVATVSVGERGNGGKRVAMAKASGTKNARAGKTYINELGPETVIQDGVAKEFNDGKPALVNLKPGDIVLPADVTADAKKNGHKFKTFGSAKLGANLTNVVAVSDGGGSSKKKKIRLDVRCPRCGTMNPETNKTCLACGWSMSKPWNAYTPQDVGTGKGDSSGSGNGSGGGNGGQSADGDIIDWIETAVDRITRKVQSLAKVAESTYKKLTTRLSASKDEIAEITKEIDLQQRAYERYMEEAASVGLDSELAALVRDGTIDINRYDKDTAQLITQYQKWYNAAIDCRDAVDDLHASLAKLYQEQFDSISEDYENRLDLVTQQIGLIDDDIALIQAKGYMETTQHYAELSKLQEDSIATMRSELSELQEALSKAVSSGEIEMYSDAYYEMQSAIGSVKNSIADATVKLQEYQNTMRELEWSYFDFAQDRFSQLPKEADFLIRLMSNHPLFDDNGKANADGMATLGLHAMNYNAYLAQADEYAKEAQKIQDELAKDPLNTDLIKRREQLLALQQESILAAEDEKDTVKDLVEQGFDLELDALKELIDAYEESLDSSKDLYEYQKKISEKTANIASVEKQLAAYANDSSEENRARVQKLQENLKKAQEDLQETEYDQYVKDQKELLSGLYDDYEEMLNARLDDVNALMTEMIAVTNENALDISRTIREASEAVGYRISDTISSIFAGDGSVAVSNYDSFAQSTPVNQAIGTIYSMIAAILANSSGITAFATGGLADFTGLAKLDGSPSKPELVLNPNETKAFLSLRDVLKTQPYLSAIDTSRYDDLIRSITSHDASVDSNVTIGDINFNVQADSYEDILRQAQRDPKFERLIAAMTTSRYLGGSSLEKNKIRFN